MIIKPNKTLKSWVDKQIKIGNIKEVFDYFYGAVEIIAYVPSKYFTIKDYCDIWRKSPALLEVFPNRIKENSEFQQKVIEFLTINKNVERWKASLRDYGNEELKLFAELS